MPSFSQTMSKDKVSKLLGLFVLAILLFNFPIIGILHYDQTIAGLPALYFYFFFVWILLIILIAITTNTRDSKRPHNNRME